jgi:hypothetical protein
MMNLLDERIDYHPSMDREMWKRIERLYCNSQYQGIADTIVQLIRRRASGVIPPSQPIPSEKRHLQRRAWPHRSAIWADTALALEPII